jgi:LCP family protein required for cell wall assembly
MATNLPGNGENGRSSDDRPDRYTGRARVPSHSPGPEPSDRPHSGGPPYGPRASEPKVYGPTVYGSRSSGPRPSEQTPYDQKPYDQEPYDQKPYDQEPYDQKPYDPRDRRPTTAQAYRSRTYRGLPYQRPPDGSTVRQTRPHWGRIAIVVTVLAGLMAACGGLVSWLWLRNVDADLKREDAFSALDERPPKLVDGALNILLLGTDSRDPEVSGEAGGAWRTDTIVLVHIPASHDRAYLVSIPRDLWVYIPRSPDGRNGDTMAKINAAYAWGGMPLAVQTVERYTGVRIDHVALIDFGGFVAVTDAVGGVDMTVEQTITSIHPPYRTFEAGTRHFTGEEALDYVRQRYQFAEGDFARMRNQQMFLRALLDKAVSLGTLANLGSLRSFVNSVADAMTVDQEFSLVDLAWQFRDLRSDDLVFLISPNLGSDMIGDQSVVVSDRETALSFYDAMARDRLAEWVSVHGTGQ